MDESFFVIGSINTDLNVSVSRFPAAGETVSGIGFSTAFGGKGANQAVALAKLCKKSTKNVLLAGKMGMDSYGQEYMHYLEKTGIQTRCISSSKEPTGIALIEIDSLGANRIVVVPGANGDIDLEWGLQTIQKIGSVIGKPVLFQLEIPVPVVCSMMRLVHESQGLVLLDPAPATELPDSIWKSIDIFTPNQSETAFFTGTYPSNDQEAIIAGEILLRKGIQTVVIKAGGTGSWLFTANDRWFCPAFPVKVCDTTAAGDSFNAGLAFALEAGQELQEALRFANAVGGLSTTGFGAQTAMPELDTVEELLQAWPKIVPRRL